MTGILFEVSGLSKSYKEVKALKNVSLNARAGEIIGIVGPNGAGKTTLMECSQGLVSYETGSITLFDEDVRHGLSQSARQRIGVAPQFFALPALLTVHEILSMYGALYRNAGPIEFAIERVGLRQQGNTRFGRLSGGQKRRLALSIALIGNPDLLFLDEPTGDLDPQSRRYIWDIIRDGEARHRRAVLIATHQMDEVEALCTRVVVIDEGRLLEDGPPQTLIARHCPEHHIRFEFDADARSVVGEWLPGVELLDTAQAPARLQARLVASDLDAVLHRILRLKEQKAAGIQDLQVAKSSLEDVFIRLTGKTLRD
ncbi:ABC transporter ATP-binding protein [Burkholderia sp. 22PA0106]|uniref:ABC transporter ATP-binding protein n=1 Tax=Burkholderia sp. 22PA0106 TaxID=3237371 RepID=UPI0039C24B34